ncbi:MAG: CRISPR-associated endonuclease Cas1 [Mastigocoleus sp. MO_167.B18]|nr:CRISPR-associated endonuclease Cas1 [Mastigocoleus sp. MO_167.B18]
MALIELQGLDPYYASLHVGNDGHAALASDLIEEFRAPVVDSLMLWLVNSRAIDVCNDFNYRDGGCFLSDTGRRKYLQAFVKRMEEQIQDDNGEKNHVGIY